MQEIEILQRVGNEKKMLYRSPSLISHHIRSLQIFFTTGSSNNHFLRCLGFWGKFATSLADGAALKRGTHCEANSTIIRRVYREYHAILLDSFKVYPSHLVSPTNIITITKVLLLYYINIILYDCMLSYGGQTR